MLRHWCVIAYTGGRRLHRQVGVTFLPHHMASRTTRQHLHTVTLSRATERVRWYFVLSSLTTRVEIVFETNVLLQTTRRGRGVGQGPRKIQNTAMCCWFLRTGFPSSDRRQYCEGLGHFANKYTEATDYRVAGWRASYLLHSSKRWLFHRSTTLSGWQPVRVCLVLSPWECQITASS